MQSPLDSSIKIKAYAVHLLTAAGIVPAALAMFELTAVDCDPRFVFVWLFITTLIDAVDGPLARRYHVKANAASIDGRTIDDLLDYLTFAFVPLLLIWRMDWLPFGFGWTTILAMMASLFGFAHTEAKDESGGFFRGFPSYWNIFAFYAGIISTMFSPWLTAILLWTLTVLTVCPIRLIYPNLAPQPWRTWLLGGAFAWAIIMLIMLKPFPMVGVVLLSVSLIYPLAYIAASFHLSRKG